MLAKEKEQEKKQNVSIVHVTEYCIQDHLFSFSPRRAKKVNGSPQPRKSAFASTLQIG